MTSDRPAKMLGDRETVHFSQRSLMWMYRMSLSSSTSPAVAP